MVMSVKCLVSIGLLFCLSSHSFAEDGEPATDQNNIPMVVLAGLDKITTQLSTIEIKRDQMVRFGSLEITLRTCRKNPPEEPPESTAFLEIVDVGQDTVKTKIFSGWMFASSPALSSLEHPIYDVWVKDCKMVSGLASEVSE